MPDAEISPLHLLKMAVGAADLDELRQARAARVRQTGGSWIYTRNHPRRAAELIAGGSLYWVIRGQIRARQRITGFRTERDDKGRSYCLIAVKPELVPTEWRAWRPFQGWRYLTPADAPADLPPGADGERAPQPGGQSDGRAMPERMRAELRALGLL